MTRQMPIQNWSCSKHDYPERCEECDTWHCDECASSEWAKVGERDASLFEEMLLALPRTRLFPHSILAEQITKEAA